VIEQHLGVSTVENPIKYLNQTLAATPTLSAWVSASAGSGKTKVLADRVLRLMLEGAEPRKILCLTFTRAAAAEMQNRIRHLLSDWATMPETDLRLAIINLTGVTPTLSQLRLARGMFSMVLDSPRGLMIQTIHAFCESLLGRFPVEAGLPPYFEVMDERTSAEALRTARDELLTHARSADDHGLIDALRVVTDWVHENEFTNLIASISSNRGRLRRLIATYNGLEGTKAAVRTFLNIKSVDTVQHLLFSACDIDAQREALLYEAANLLSEGGKRDQEKSGKINAWLKFSPDNRVAVFDTYASTYLTGNDSIRLNLISKSISEKNPNIIDILQCEAERVRALVEKRKAIWTAESTEAMLTIAISLIGRYEGYKKQNALLDYDDLILKARALVENSASWVLYKLDGGIDHVLIDEAQDSNADQWAVVRSIVDEFFSGENASRTARTIFAVGDEKQSIFSFQGAAPYEFENMNEYFADKAKAVGQEWCTVPLDVSFRSTPAVLQAVDAVFLDGDVRKGVTSSTIEHTAHRNGQAGLVEVWPPVTPVDREEDPDFAVAETRKNIIRPVRKLAYGIAATISRWLREGERLSGADRPICPGDIMILVRRRTDFVDTLIHELKAHEVRVAGVDRMVLTDQISVRDLITVGTFALMPDDDLNLATLLKGPLIGWGEEQVFKLCYGREGTVWRALSSKRKSDEAYAKAFKVLADIHARADMTPPYEFFAYVLGAMAGRASLLARLRHEANDPIDEFLSLSLSFENAHTPSLQGFLQWVEQGQAEIKRDLDQGVLDEVRVMTVHGAKGLQAPIVILADTVQTPTSAHDLLWGNTELDKTLSLPSQNGEIFIWSPRSRTQDFKTKQLVHASQRHQDEEYRRLLYVGMTRAQDRLYVAGYSNHPKVPDASWWNLVHRGLEPLAKSFNFISPTGAGTDPNFIWEGEGLRLETPQTEKPDQCIDEKENSDEFSDIPSWVDTPAPREAEVAKTLTPSLGESEQADIQPLLRAEEEEYFQRGLLIHQLLQFLPNLSEKRREISARNFLERPIYGLSKNQIELIVTETMGVMNDPICRSLFGPSSRAEVPIVGVLNSVPVSGRIDRVVVDKKIIKILDFKTNRLPPVSVDGVPEDYLRQVAIYRTLLEKIYNNQNIECMIIWTNGPTLMVLDKQLLSGYVP